jgi:DNA-binding PadR family transcriptional regulator
MQRDPSVLLPLEANILDAGLSIQGLGSERFHGFLLARVMQEREGARRLTAHGTLYKALGRLERSGLLESTWEDPMLAAEAGRPRRRLYRVTIAGERALAKAERRVEPAAPAPHPVRGDAA